MGRQLHSQSVAPFVPRTRLLDWAFSGTLLQRRVRWMFFAGFRCVFGLPSTPAGQGNQPLSRELEAVLCAQARKPSAMHVGEKRPAAGGCLQACIGKDRVRFYTGGAPDQRPGRIAQSPGQKAAVSGPSLPRPAQLLPFAPGGNRLQECGRRDWCLTGASAQLSPSLWT